MSYKHKIDLESKTNLEAEALRKKYFIPRCEFLSNTYVRRHFK